MQGKGLKSTIAAFVLVLVLATGFAATAFAEDSEPLASQAVMARLASPAATGSLGRIQLAPILLEGGASLTFISPEKWSPLSLKLAAKLRSAHTQFTRLLGNIPSFSAAIRLMDEDTFYLTTGAPRWTNALYFRGEIIIPLSHEGALDTEGISRSVIHEYTHAVLNTLSRGRCPGWLDEGLAQWSEGGENAALRPALSKWLRYREPVPLTLLQGGFTRLDSEMVPAAYAQSLFAANTVINTFGFRRTRAYLDKLSQGADKPDAFQEAYGMSEAAFEQRLGVALRGWANRSAHRHR